VDRDSTASVQAGSTYASDAMDYRNEPRWPRPATSPSAHSAKIAKVAPRGGPMLRMPRRWNQTSEQFSRHIPGGDDCPG